jgi:hypothetical protein
MLLNSKRGQLSIEMVILILAVLLSGTVLAAHMTKDTNNAGEVKALKKLTLGAFSNSAIESGASMIPEEEEEAEPEDEEETIEESDEQIEIEKIANGIRINPGNGRNEFYITNSNDGSEYDLLNGQGLILNESTILIKQREDGTYSSQATYIKVRPIGSRWQRSVLVNGITYNNLQLIVLESSDPTNPMEFTISHYGNAASKYYLTITAEKATVTIYQ